MKQSKRALAVFVAGSMMMASIVGGCAAEAAPQPESQPLVQSWPQPPGEAAKPVAAAAHAVHRAAPPPAVKRRRAA